ncbi:MAG: CBS domain-containing protein [Phycisphaerae bacterium]|nr:CBS domain-containing protein [Phycisphaerae bacterium]
MKSNKRLNDLIEIEARGVSSDCLITCSRTWLAVADVMSKNVATISPDETVVSAAKMMSERGISCLAVMDGGQVAGILTETDMLRRVARNGKHFYQTKLGQIMSHSVKSVFPDMSVLEASEIMSEMHIKRLPIIEQGELVGIVTQTDLVRALTSYGLWRDVSEIMSRNVAAVPDDATVAEAAEIMTLRKISCIVLLDGGEAAGVLTQKDMIRRVVALQRDPARVRMREVMSSPVTSIPANCSVVSASKMMEEMSIRRLVVTEDKRLAGVVTQSDIFMAVSSKLKAEEEQNLSSLEESKNNIYTTDLDGMITYVNPAFMKLLEVSNPEELIGQPFLPEHFGLDSQARETFLRELEKGSIESRELALKTSQGNRIYVTVFPSVTKDIRRAINGSQGIVYDVTAKKELVALREAEEKLENVNKDLASAVRELQRTNKELAEFAHIAAHDLRTPLRVMGTLADWISTGYGDKLDEQGKEQLRLLVGKARQMSALIDDILQYSRLGQDNRKRQPIELNAILSEIIASIAPPDNIEIAVENNLPTIMFEETQVLQVFQNLLSNAVKYMDKPKGQIKVGCAEEDNFWRFSVADNGPGIEERYFERIFKVFQTLSLCNSVESTGIGLSIVRKIAELNGGNAWVESEVGKGSTFFFTLQK